MERRKAKEVNLPGTPLPSVLSESSVRLIAWQSASQQMVDARIALIARNSVGLSRWMPWMRSEPLDEGATRRLFMQWEASRREGREAVYAIEISESGPLGSLGVHRRLNDNGVELGFWIDRRRSGQGIATDSVTSALRNIFLAGIADYAEIHVDPANTASQRVPEKCGLSLRGSQYEPIRATAHTGTQQIWRITSADWRASQRLEHG